MSLPRLLSSYAFDPVLSAPDSILDSVSDNNGVREGVNGTTGHPLVRFLNASSFYCELGSCVTFWAFSSMATMMSAGRITLSSALDFPTFGGAINSWCFASISSTNRRRARSLRATSGCSISQRTPSNSNGSMLWCHSANRVSNCFVILHL